MNRMLLALAAVALGAAAVRAQPPILGDKSLADKSVAMVIASGAGGGFDLWGRTVARHLGRHLPGSPNVVPQNMPGAGGFVAANYLYNVAPKDGTALGIIAAGTAFGPVIGASGARFDATRFTWVGTPTMEIPVCIAFRGPQVKVGTVADLYRNELVVGSTGPGAGPHTWPKALSALLGMKFKVVAGFQSTANVLLAMERGEIDGICTILDTIVGQRPDWIAQRKIALLFHGGGAPSPLLKDVPYIGDLVQNSDDRAAIEFLFAGVGFGRPFIAPPGMAAERVKMLQEAFMATMQSPDFRADANKQKLDVDPQDGAYLAALIKKVYGTPKAIVDRVAALIK